MRIGTEADQEINCSRITNSADVVCGRKDSQCKRVEHRIWEESREGVSHG